MPEGGVLFHDLVLRPSGDGAALLEPLLGHFAEATRSHETAIEVELELVRAPCSPELGELLASKEGVTLHRSESGFVISDGVSWVEASQAPVALKGEIELDETKRRLDKEVVYTALLLALRSQRWFELHAAAVQPAGFTLVIVGDSGSGKSTLATALLEAGCGYLGDDRVLVREGAEGRLELLSFPAAFRLTEQTAAAFPRLAPWLHGSRHKRELDLRGACPGRHVPRATAPYFVLFPERAPRTALTPLAKADALAALVAQSSSLVIPDHPAPQSHLTLLRALAQRSVTLRAQLGPEWLENPVSAASALLARCSGWGAA
jgi:hypothetical protein